MAKQHDMDVLDFARAISMRENSTPIADAYDLAHGQKENRWWACQREHLTVWCLYYPTDGFKGFKHKPNKSARSMYNHFRRPETLLWLAESLGEDTALLEQLAEQMVLCGDDNTAVKLLRKQIPFDRILKLLKA